MAVVSHQLLFTMYMNQITETWKLITLGDISTSRNFNTNTMLFVINQILPTKSEADLQYSLYYLNNTAANFP